MKKFGLRNLDTVITTEPIEKIKQWNDLDDHFHDYLDTMRELGYTATRGDLIYKMIEESGGDLKEVSTIVSQVTSKLKGMGYVQ